jgi:cysteine desulfurase
MAYFDHNSTTRPLPEVLDAVRDASERNWANPSSPHRPGSRVRALLEKAREEIAQSLGVVPGHLTFTSGATESNNAILSRFAKSLNRNQPVKVFVSSIEHPSILETAQFYFPDHLTLIPVCSEGKLDLQEFEKLLNDQSPQLVSMMAAHNESGVIQPWQEVAQICRERGVWFHCDATQWIGKLNHDGLNACSSFSFSAHKFGGPKGVGGLVSRQPMSFLKGGGQEKEGRGGTENFPDIEGMRVAWSKCCTSIPNPHELVDWKKDFENSLLREFSNLKIIGHKVPRLWNTTLLHLPQFDHLTWVGKLDKMGFHTSTGSACSNARDQSSSLVRAIGLDESASRQLLRVSSYWSTTSEDWQGLTDAFKNAFVELQSEQVHTGVISLK